MIKKTNITFLKNLGIPNNKSQKKRGGSIVHEQNSDEFIRRAEEDKNNREESSVKYVIGLLSAYNFVNLADSLVESNAFCFGGCNSISFSKSNSEPPRVHITIRGFDDTSDAELYSYSYCEFIDILDSVKNNFIANYPDKQDKAESSYKAIVDKLEEENKS